MYDKRLVAAIMSACLAFLAQPAMAAKGFNYTYMEGGYRNLDADSIEADGFEAGISFGATDYIHIIGRYSRLFVDDIDGASNADDLDIDEFKIGFGGHYPIMEKVDLVGEVSYVDEQITGKARLDDDGQNVDGTGPKVNINEKEEGYEATFYARVQAMKKLEMTPHVVYRDVGSDSDTGFGLGLVYKFYKKLSVRVRGTHFSDDSATNLFLGMRVDM